MKSLLARVRQQQTSICLEPFLSNPHLFGHASIGYWWSMLPLCCTRAGPGWLLIKPSWRMDESTCLCCKSGLWSSVLSTHSPVAFLSLHRLCLCITDQCLPLPGFRAEAWQRQRMKTQSGSHGNNWERKEGEREKGELHYELGSTHQWMSLHKTVDVLSSQYQALFLQEQEK